MLGGALHTTKSSGKSSIAPDLNISSVSALNCSTLATSSPSFSFSISVGTGGITHGGASAVCDLSDRELSADEGAGER